MGLEKAIELFENIVLKSGDQELEEIYLAINSGVEKIKEEVKMLKVDNELLDKELEERKEVLWELKKNSKKYQL